MPIGPPSSALPNEDGAKFFVQVLAVVVINDGQLVDPRP
jgi:hypothetical protein